MTRIKVLIADALPLFSQALGIAIGLNRDFNILPEHPSNGPAALEAAVRMRPDVAVLDYWLPDMEGPVLTRAVVSKVPKCKVILSSWMFGLPQIQQALDAGVSWFLPKDVDVDYVAEAIRRAHQGLTGANEDQLQDLIKGRTERVERDLQGFEDLTPREVEILALLNAGQTISLIAKRLSLSQKTVRNHISQILSKTHSQSQIEAVAKARSCGFLKI